MLVGVLCNLLMFSRQWGVVGPRRILSHGQLYYGLVFFSLAGAIAPVIQWTLQRKYKKSFLRYLNFPVIFGSTAFIPVATPLNYVVWVFICFVFNYMVRRRYTGWWLKYNCSYLS
jgi:OPT oligopeptide transporter protein